MRFLACSIRQYQIMAVYLQMTGAHRDWDSNKYVLPCFVSILLLLISWITGLRRTYEKKRGIWWSLAQAVRVNDTRHIPIIATYNTYHSPIKNKREKSQTHIPRDVVLYKKATIRHCKKRCKPMGGRVVYIPFMVGGKTRRFGQEPMLVTCVVLPGRFSRCYHSSGDHVRYHINVGAT